MPPINPNIIRVSPPKFTKPPYVSETGLLTDPNLLYKKQSQASYPALKNIKTGNIDKVDDEICDVATNPPDTFNVLDSNGNYGPYYTKSIFIDQGQSGTCVTAAQATRLSLKLSKLLDFPFVIDYCLFLKNIYYAFDKYNMPQLKKFGIRPDGTFYPMHFPAHIRPNGRSTIDYYALYAFDYLMTEIPITVYPICDSEAKPITYKNPEEEKNELGLTAKPNNCISKPEKCGITISLQNFKANYVLDDVCSIKQYLMSNNGQVLGLSIAGGLWKWLQEQAENNDAFNFPEDVDPSDFAWSTPYGWPRKGHQLCIVGWSTPQPGYTAFIFKNSWGVGTTTNFSFIVKDTDYHSRLFDPRPVRPAEYDYDIIFTDYQDKSLEEIRSIFKDKIQDCCGLGTCCGDEETLDYCEENISIAECLTHQPASLVGRPYGPTELTNSCNRLLFTPNRAPNNIENLPEIVQNCPCCSSSCITISYSEAVGGDVGHCGQIVLPGSTQTINIPEGHPYVTITGGIDDELLIDGVIIQEGQFPFEGCNGAHAVDHSFSKVGSFTVACADNHGVQSGYDLTICFSTSQAQ